MPEIRDRSTRAAAPREKASTSTRRDFLAASSTGAAALGVSASFAQKAYARPSMNLGTRSDLNFLMQRATRGFNKNEMALMQQTGVTPQVYLDWLLDVAPTIPDTAANNWIAPLSTWLDSIPCQYWGVSAQAGPCAQSFLGAGQITPAIVALQGAMIGRSVYTLNRLFDTTVEFLTNHLNIFIYKDLAGSMKPLDDKTVVRQHAFGSYPALVKASAQSTAMLWYLDNVFNGAATGPMGPIPNENYARELLELHTIAPEDPLNPGVPNYTENDVKEVAKVLSGWRFRIPGGFPADLNFQFGDFFFDPSFHVSGSKTVLGYTFHNAANPKSEGDELLKRLLDPVIAHVTNPVARLTACYLAYKLARWFLLDAPDANLVNAVARVYRTDSGSMKGLLRELLKPSFLTTYNTPANLKFKTPYTLVCSLFRATEADLANNQGAILNELADLGQAPYGWAPPDGYPISVEAWGKNLFPRWAFCHNFFARPNGNPGIAGIDLTDAKLASLLGGFPSLQLVPYPLVGGLVEAMLCGAGAMASLDVQIVQAFVDYVSVQYPLMPKEEVLREACALGASTPSFQYY